tara:strand:- start:1968 stop:3116 length:1149 start_codon:yes stop_codon:yes gene_type:complete
MTKKKDLGNNYFRSGWQPSAEIDEQSGLGEITHVGTDPDYRNKFDSILQEWGFNPEHYEIDGKVKASSWMTQMKGGRVETFYAFKGIVRRKHPARDEWFAVLLKDVSKKKPLKKKKITSKQAFIWCMSDWQLGKDDYGVENTLKRYDLALQRGVEQVKALGGVDEIYLLSMGDLTEGCYGFYDSQPFNISLTLQQQYHLARKLIMKTVDTFLPYANKIVLSGVPANHGEMSRSGKGQVVTNRLDNSDTMHIEICGEIMAQNPRYKKVTVSVPEGFHHTLTIKNLTLAFSHGHMHAGGSGPEGKIMKWWQGQMFGHLPPGEADILITGHFHHPRLMQQGNRTWMQCPSIDASTDFTARTGMWSKPGVLCFTIDKDGWDNYKIV